MTETMSRFLSFSAKHAVGIAACLLLAVSSGAQTAATPAKPSATDSSASASADSMFRELESKYPGLLTEFGNLAAKLQGGVQMPSPRSESRILPLLPETTVLYAAIPNYGDAARQTLRILREELKESVVLREWLQKNPELSAAEPKLEDSLERVSQLHEFLGNEIVISGAMNRPTPNLLIVAEVRKPGLKNYLQQTIAEFSGKSAPGVRVFEPQGLAALEGKTRLQDLLVLVRPDFVVAATDLPTLKNFNGRLDQHVALGGAGAFKQRVAAEYRDGLTLVAGADLQKILSQAPPALKQKDSPLQKSGFADAKYLLWDHKETKGETISQAELSFTSARQGAAAWLAKSRPLSTLGFASPKAMMAGTVVLNNPAQIFEDIKVLAGPNQNAFASLAQFEKVLNLSLRDDVLANLTGELTVELDEVTAPNAAWRAVLKVRDSEHLRQTFDKLLAVSGMKVDHAEDAGITYNTFRVPRAVSAENHSQAEPAPPIEISYAFADGHLIIGSGQKGSGQKAVRESVQLHRSGASLAKSQTLLAALLPGHSLEASAMLYQDPVAMGTLQLQRFAPALATSLEKLRGQLAPSVVGIYADDRNIREASRSSGFDVGAALVVAAVAIPNLVRSRTAANEASAVGTVRTIAVAQVTYEVAYPKRGYAPTLAALGPDPAGANKPSPEHADLVSESLARENCTADGWCTKSGYRLSLKSVCKLSVCTDYVMLATPVADNTGTRSFCSTSDGIVRTKSVAPLSAPISVKECQAWEPLH